MSVDSESIKKEIFKGIDGINEAMTSAIGAHHQPFLNRAIKKNSNVNVRFKYLSSSGEYVDMIPVVYAMIVHNNDAVITLLNTGKIDLTPCILGAPALIWAARTGNLVTTQAILAHGFSVNSMSSDGETPLLSTLLRLTTFSILNKSEWEDLDSLELLKKWHDDRFGTIKIPENLSLSCRFKGNLDMVELLLKRGAEVDFDRILKEVNVSVSPIKFVENPKMYSKIIADDRGWKKINLISANDDELKFNVTLVNLSNKEVTATLIYDFRELRELIRKYAIKNTGKGKEAVEVKALREQVEKMGTDVHDVKKKVHLSAYEQEKMKKEAEESRIKAEMAEMAAIAAMQKSKEMDKKVRGIERDAAEVKQLAEDTAVLAHGTYTALAPKIEINLKETALRNRNAGNLVMTFCGKFAVELRRKLMTSILLSSGEVTREKTKLMDKVGAGVSHLAGVIHVPIISKFVEGIGIGIGKVSDYREKNKNGKVNASAGLDIDDLCKAISIEIAEHYERHLGTFVKEADVDKLVSKGTEELVDDLKAGKFAKADAFDYTGACKQLANVVICSKKFNEEFEKLRRSQPAKLAPVTPAYHAASAAPSARSVGMAARSVAVKVA